MPSTKFKVMCSLFNWMQKSKSSAKKRSKFRKFLDIFCKPSDYFSAIRLILPSLDRERGSYGLKESVLATCLIDALGISRESNDAIRLVNWRKGGAKTGASAGNFSQVAAEVLQLRQGTTSGELTIKELNDILDRLASSENRAEKTSVLSELIQKTNAQEMKWIVMIILKDLKLGTSEKSIFHEFHPDAEDLFNVTCDLKLVCEKLRDRSQRHKRQDIEVGKPVRPQLALRVGNAAGAWKKLHGKEVVVECKFDGDRIQIHKNGEDIHFFSRNFLDHPEYGHAMSKIIKKNVVTDRCILDGEMLVWDTSTNRFAEFGSNQEIAKAAKEGLENDRQLCYVAFDILYVGDTSVIHQSLKERHELLQKVVKPIKGCLEILVPNGSPNFHRPSGEPCWSLIAYSVDDVERFFKETIDNRDEGIVLKDLASKWEPSDRSIKWLKLKPEYIRAGSDLDVLIIGGYYGSGRHGGEVAQFLVGLAERPTTNAYPRRFISFCRVGTGLSDEELDAVVTKLKPYFRKYEYPKKAAPSFYQVTNNSKERPDVWIDSPEKSIILSINSDIRTIRSEVFAAPYSLRFPRIDRVRYDKPWHECLDVQSFIELVHSSNGTTQREGDQGVLMDDKPKRTKVSRNVEKNNVTVVPSHFIQTDVSDIKGETLIFSSLMFYFVNLPPTQSLDSLHRLVAENGGTSSMNLNNTVTHCIAAESKGIKFQAAKLRGDVIHYSWLFDCCSQKKLLPLKPKYFLHLSEQSKKLLEEEIDEFSDSYFLDLDIVDLKQLLSNVDRSEDSKSVDYYKKKYCPKDKWSRFTGCCIYFHLSTQSFRNSESKSLLELAQRRLKLEVLMGGGKVSNSLSQASHLVIQSLRFVDVDISASLNSFSTADVHRICNKKMHVVGSQWLEDSIESSRRLTEDTYSIKLEGLEDLNVAECENELKTEDELDIDDVGKQYPLDSPGKDEKHRKRKAIADDYNSDAPRKKYSMKRRGRPATTSRKDKKAGKSQPKRLRARVGNKPAKIRESESDVDASSEDTGKKEESEIGLEIHEVGDLVDNKERVNTAGHEISEFSESSQRGKVIGNKDIVGTEESKRVDSVHETGMEEKNSIGLNEKLEKLEVMVDPVQSMLLDMIPSLGTQTSAVTESKPQLSDPNAVNTSKPQPSDPNPVPAKKKKVSYKDLAYELLRD
ncbi:DNA ligase [Heracleum sosnowskyi]|uniref:DNA ligase n=1 Tax=Heracleum sosnowskyi TaxID=360622 RepID=A0AAD8HGJ4_9APIA|nr:DNA ligase [Heracleum sosnowskyi]